MRSISTISLILVLLPCSTVAAQTRVAVIASQAGGVEKLAPLLELELGKKQGIVLLEREKVQEVFREQELSTLLAASRVVGASVKGNVRDDLGKLVEDLAKQVSKTVTERADELVARPVSRDDRVAALKKKLGDAKRPSVLIEISEHHVGQALVERPSVVVVVGVARNTIDPAAETEATLFSTETGFKVIDPKEGRKKDADILISGEAFSEVAVRHGNLISVKARVEVKAVDQKSGRIVASDRQTTVAVDLTEQIAAKNALQEAGAQLAERLLPKIVGAKEK